MAKFRNNSQKPLTGMRWIGLLAIAIFFCACNNNKDAPDVSGIKADVKVVRFDKDFFSIDTSNLLASIQTVQKKYPAFLPIYFEYFSPIDFMVKQQGKSYDSATKEFYRNIKPLYDSVQKKITSTDDIQRELSSKLRYVKYYYPSFKVPAVLTTVESLNPENPMEVYGTTYYHDSLIISLQMFLGKDFQVYDPSQYPDYLRRRFQPLYIVPNCIRAIANDLYADSSEGATLIEQMIEKGKLWYLMSKFLPDEPDSLITGYSTEQTEWCNREEGNAWGYIRQNEDLFSIDQSTIQGYIGEAPFTEKLPHDNSGQGAPGNIGPWFGWKIIQAFVEKNPKLKLQQVLATPAKKIFQESKYKPK